MAWDSRHHVGGAPTKPLPAPKSFTAKHGGPIKPKVDMSTPVSMTAPSSRHNRSRRPLSSQRTADKKFEPVLKPDLKSEAFRPSYPEAKAKDSRSARLNTQATAQDRSEDIGWFGAGEEGEESMESRLAEISAELEQSKAHHSVVALAQRHAASTTLKQHDSWKAAQKDATADVMDHKSGGGFKSSSKEAEEKETKSDLTLDIAPDKSLRPGAIDEDKEVESNGFGLQLDIGSIRKEAAERTEALDGFQGGSGWAGARASGAYELSASGTFVVDKFTIRREGTVRNSHVNGRNGDDISSQVGVGVSLVSLGVLGHGASSVVQKALHVPTLRLVAVKKISVFDDAKRHQMIRELRALHRNKVALNSVEWGDQCLDGPSCECMVSFFDAFTEMNDGAISLVMEYMDGGSLQDIVDTGGCRDEGVLANISYRCLKGLVFLHENHQIHRDIKPANLLINHQGHVKVSDFGIVREVEDSGAVAETFVGTYTYMSPERVGGLPYSFNADVWSLGLSLLTCALGEFPYSTAGGYWGLLNEIKGSEPKGLTSSGFSEALTDFLQSCLEKDPDVRPSAMELLEHPFVSGCTMSEQAPPSEDDEGSATARLELDDLVHSLRLFYQRLWAQQSKAGVSPSIPNFHRKKVARLSHQLGVSEVLARMKFATLVHSLRIDAERFWTENEE